MSGVEVLGLLASVAQLAAYTGNITNTIVEIYRRVQDTPKRIRQLKEQLRMLIHITELIRSDRALQTKEVEDHVRSTLEQAKLLNKLLEKVKVEYSQSTARKLWTAVLHNKEKEIVRSFEQLEQRKSALHFCVSLSHSTLLGDIRNSVDQLHYKQGSPPVAMLSPLGPVPQSIVRLPTLSVSTDLLSVNRRSPPVEKL